MRSNTPAVLIAILFTVVMAGSIQAAGPSAENPGISAVGEVLGRCGFGIGSGWFGGLGGTELGFQAPVDPSARSDVGLDYSTGLSSIAAAIGGNVLAGDRLLHCLQTTFRFHQ